jgi:deoxyribodipyrimidine photolyase-related protein
MNMMMALLEKMKMETLEAHVLRAEKIIANPDYF